MRGSKTAVIAGLVVTAATATMLKAQQMLGRPAAAAAAPADPDLSQRSARQLLKNGLDYLNTYQDYDHAVRFLREAARRPTGLNNSERNLLADGLTRAEEGKAAADAAASSGEATADAQAPRKPIASAWARSRRPARDRQVATASTGSQSESLAVRKTSAESADPAEPPSMDLPQLPPAQTQANDAPTARVVENPASTQDATKDESPKPATAVAKTASEPIFLTGSSEPEPKKAAEQAPADAPPGLEEVKTAQSTPAPADAPPVLADVKAAPVEAPALPAPTDTPPLSAEPTPAPVAADAPPGLRLPARDAEPRTAAPTESPASTPVATIEVPKADKPVAAKVKTEPTASPANSPMPLEDAPAAPLEAPVVPSAAAAEPRTAVPVASRTAPVPATAPNPVDAPATDADELPPLPTTGSATEAAPRAASPLDTVRSLGSTLSPETLREVEEVARRQDEALRQNPPVNLNVPSPSDTIGPDDLGATSRLVLPRAPSPTEPRPIRVIPVPEEFVPLPKRQWEPSRKYWAAAATCHMPLYFQDAVLERYGQSVEQAVGPAGRFLSYPLDDPRQSNQRNNLIQPMYSAGLFITQLALLPYNMLMDPPWEPEYDLGYYRPGDKIPSDTYYLPKTGIGPFLRGNKY